MLRCLFVHRASDPEEDGVLPEGAFVVVLNLN